MATLLELAERVEAGSAGDRDLNADILRALGWRNDNGESIRPSGHNTLIIPDYTTSLDDALTLVPNPGKWSVTAGHGENAWEASIWLKDGHGLDWRSAATPALALTAACLRARHALGAGDGEGGRG